ncbi:hypothetical protein [Phenylobacterium sp.]|uniref:hypothetical protein n=1 Tax=Phenylobacterium sp. TaxID=1871053 RepID=UPI00272FD068|nr:hypothetical protein [Phenylobacterium sp.]MDP1599036.1 hypothetical protein [Phenylobacterium sp.]MDP3590464.1 hypothetical protein [Phenylobacterium sp.]
MGEGFIELELSAYLTEALSDLEEGTAAHGIALQVLNEDGTEGLSPDQLRVWEKVIWPAIGAVQRRHQRHRLDE